MKTSDFICSIVQIILLIGEKLKLRVKLADGRKVFRTTISMHDYYPFALLLLIRSWPIFSPTQFFLSNLACIHFLLWYVLLEGCSVQVMMIVCFQIRIIYGDDVPSAIVSFCVIWYACFKSNAENDGWL